LLIHSKKISWLKLVSINAAPNFGRLDVLVVENDPDQLSLFTEILAAAGFTVQRLLTKRWRSCAVPMLTCL